MLELICLRHWPTRWNAEKRLQGRCDLPLSETSIEALQRRRIPASLTAIRWYCSPLRRARETAELLGLGATPEASLIEMDWGDWEGKTVLELREADPDGMAELEDRGLNLLPPGGESPREVLQRVSAWAEVMRLEGRQQLGAVCHKGVIRALLAAACDWDMRGRAPEKLDYRCLQHFLWDGQRWSLGEINRPLADRMP
ncbi:histidine phosphatase family protein [Marinobacterium aestuariivivens]|uniref:Histidine phosphatase family protein n=1 Tax=Marinobacterium aestuariivivens TaxID=1698799 RepID=A0ABW1ZU78_9GAMM